MGDPATYTVIYSFAVRAGEVTDAAATDLKIYQPPQSVSLAALALTQRIYQNIEQGFDVAIDGIGGAPEKAAGWLFDSAIRRMLTPYRVRGSI